MILSGNQKRLSSVCLLVSAFLPSARAGSPAITPHWPPALCMHRLTRDHSPLAPCPLHASAHPRSLPHRHFFPLHALAHSGSLPPQASTLPFRPDHILVAGPGRSSPGSALVASETVSSVLFRQLAQACTSFQKPILPNFTIRFSIRSSGLYCFNSSSVSISFGFSKFAASI